MQRIIWINPNFHIWLANIKDIAETVRLNIIVRIMQNKSTKNLFGSIYLAMTTLYMLY